MLKLSKYVSCADFFFHNAKKWNSANWLFALKCWYIYKWNMHATKVTQLTNLELNAFFESLLYS